MGEAIRVCVFGGLYRNLQKGEAGLEGQGQKCRRPRDLRLGEVSGCVVSETEVQGEQ